MKQVNSNNTQQVPTIRIYVRGGTIQDIEAVEDSFHHQLDIQIVDVDENAEQGKDSGEITWTRSLNK